MLIVVNLVANVMLFIEKTSCLTKFLCANRQNLCQNSCDVGKKTYLCV